MNSSVLNNMSAPPGTVIRHSAPATPGRPRLFRLRPEGRHHDARTILAVLDGRAWPGTATQAETELRSRLNEHAARLPFPPAVVATQEPGTGEPVEDLLTVCTILAKSSDRVYLRDKEPNLNRITSGRCIVLRFPEPNPESREGTP